MTNQQHPITPPPELIEKWHSSSPLDRSLTVATQAARWGADQELEACYEWVVRDWTDIQSADMLLAARRPKSPSLKEQALAELEILSDYAHGLNCSESAIRRALEALPE